MKPINPSLFKISGYPLDLGLSNDARTVENLTQAENITCDESNMWLVPITSGKTCYLTISFFDIQEIGGVRIWNYNKCSRLSGRGVKAATISADGNFVTPSKGVILKRGPGCDLFDYSQPIPLPFDSSIIDSKLKIVCEAKKNSKMEIPLQTSIVNSLPIGFTLKICILSAIEDIHYVGLECVELLDFEGKNILEGEGRIPFKFTAEPYSIRVLKGCENDPRVADNILSKSDIKDDRKSWLCPLLNSRNETFTTLNKNTLYFSFDLPVVIGGINFHNYRKLPSRGAYEIEVSMDENIIYSGYLKRSVEKADFDYTSVLFFQNEKFLELIKPSFHSEENKKQSVLMTNERKIMNPAKKKAIPLVFYDRPKTSSGR